MTNKSRITLSFYKYFYIFDTMLFKKKFFNLMSSLQVLGRVYIATEGINAQISIFKNNFNEFFDSIYNIDYKLNDMILNIALDNDIKSFKKLKVKIKKKIVNDGIQDLNFHMNQTGKYLNAKEVNFMLDNFNTLLIDVRNHYEYKIGHFKNSISISSNNFREQLKILPKILKSEKEKNIILYCTGGIRCEKASSWMLFNGFKSVYHIKGGILRYMQQIKKENLSNKFIGKNFVFDLRFSEKITDDIIANCHQCNMNCDSYTNCLNDTCHKLFIQCKTCKILHHGYCSLICQQ